MFTLAVICSLLLSAVSASSVITKRASVCNGHQELCGRGFGNVSFVGAHNSYAVGSTNIAANQDYNITVQLNDGIRMLQSQAHEMNGEIHLCHTSCLLLDGGTLANYLQSVKSWMDANPNEVVSLLIVNIENLAASAYASVFQSVGLSDLAYAPPKQTLGASEWPTLGEMIDSGKRLVVFLDNGANDTSIPWLVDEFTNIWETAFDVTDPNFDCEVNRTKGDTNSQMYLINHFLDTNMPVFGNISSLTPAKDQLVNTNGAGSEVGMLGKQASDCTAQHGRAPNFMLVDFYEYGGGSVFQVAASLNGVPAPSNTVASVPASGSGTASSGGDPGSAVALIMEMRGLAGIGFAGLTMLLSGYLLDV